MKRIIILVSFVLILTMAFVACSDGDVGEGVTSDELYTEDISESEAEISAAETDEPETEESTAPDTAAQTTEPLTTNAVTTDAVTTEALTTEAATTEAVTTAPSGGGIPSGGGVPSGGGSVGGGTNTPTNPCANGHDFDENGECKNCDAWHSVGLKFFSKGDGTCYVSGRGNCQDTEIIIPEKSSANDLVIGIGYGAFESFIGLTSIEIPEGVTSIGPSAFSGCRGLTEIEIPASVTSIHDSAFLDCSNLKNVTFEKNSVLTNIADSAFSGCKELTSIKIPEGVTTIGENAFSGCKGLTSIEIPASVTSIHGSAFLNCVGLKSVTFEKNSVLTSIGNRAFYGCSELTSIEIPASVTSIYGSAFLNCIGLNSITFEKNSSLTSIGNRAFYGCSGLEGVELPENVTSIGAEAFSNCSGLVSVEIPKGVTSIGEKIFGFCSNLESITVENGNTKYHSAGNCVIETETKTLITGCKNSIIPTDGSVTTIGEYAFYSCSGLSSIEIPSSITSIGDSAFYGCSGLSSIEIPKSVTSIAENAFYGCQGLTSVIFEKGSELTIIGERAFSGCGEITGIEIPNSVTSIGKYGLSSCKSVTFEENSKLARIGVFVFSGNRRLVSIEIPKSVRGIDNFAFENCKGLKSITFEENSELESIASSAFYGCSGLETITLPESVTSIGFEAFLGCKALTDIKIPKGVTSIEYNTFLDCSSLQSIDIPEGLTSIAYDAFRNCSGLKIIELPESITYIGGSAFSGCSGLEAIELPKNVTSIGNRAFYACSGLKSIAVESGNTKYHSAGNCLIETETKTLILGCENSIIPTDGSVTSIGELAFYKCSGLESIVIPKIVTSIGAWAFDMCSGLETINYTGTEEQWNAITKGMNWGSDAGSETEKGKYTVIYNYGVPHDCIGGDSLVEKYVKGNCTVATTYDLVIYCTICNKELSRIHTSIPATGHAEVSHVAKAPTCKDVGWNAYVTCSRCDYTTYEEIAPLRWMNGSIPAFSLDTYRMAGQKVLAAGNAQKSPTVDGIASVSEYSSYRELMPVGYASDFTYNFEDESTISTTPYSKKGVLTATEVQSIINSERARYFIAEDGDNYYIAVQKISGATNDLVVTRARFAFTFAIDMDDPKSVFNFDIVGQGRKDDGWLANETNDALVFDFKAGYTLGGNVNLGTSEYGDIVTSMKGSLRVTDTPTVITDDYSNFNKIATLHHYNGWVTTSHLMTVEMSISKAKIREHLGLMENETLPDGIFFSLCTRDMISSGSNYTTSSTSEVDSLFVLWNGTLVENTDRDTFGAPFIPDLLVFGKEMNYGCDWTAHNTDEKYRVPGEDNKYYHSCKNCGSVGVSTFEAYGEKKESCTENGHNAYISCESCNYNDKVVKNKTGHDYNSSGKCKNCGLTEFTLPSGINTYYAQNVSTKTPQIDGEIKVGEYGTAKRISTPRATKGDDVNTKWETGSYDSTLASKYIDFYFAYDEENIYIAFYELGPELIDNGDKYTQNDVAFRNNHFFQLGFDLGDATSYLYFGGFATNNQWEKLCYVKKGSTYTAPFGTSALINESVVKTIDKASGKVVGIGDLVSTNGIINNPNGRWEVTAEFKLRKADILSVVNELYGTNYTELSDAMWIGMTTNAFKAKTSDLNDTYNQRLRWLGTNDITGKQGDYTSYGYSSSSTRDHMLDVVVLGSRGSQLHSADADPCSSGHLIVNHTAKAPTAESVGWEAYATCERCSYTTYKKLPMLGNVFKTGYARCIFTPTPPIGKFTSVHDDLYATCVAVNDGEKTLLLLSIDMKSMSINGNDNLKALISHGTGIPTENIFISVTHTHSVTPFGAEIVWTYNSYKKIANMVKEAIADLTDCEMLAGTGKTTGMAWVRRYINSEGYMAAVSPGALFSDPTTRSVSEADDTLQTIRFVREGKKDIVLMNWQGHLAHGEGQIAYQISADMAQYLREDIESGDKDTLIAYFAGASGNLNLNAPNKSLVQYSDGNSANNHYEVVAHALAKVTLEVIDPSKMTKLETGEIKIVKEVYAALMKKDSPEAIAAAQARKDAGTNTKADDYLLARNKKESLDLRIAAISFGDLGLVTVPYEMFDNNGVQIKEGSPFKMTFVLTNSDGDYAYMPSTEAWTTYGGYETEATYFANGTAEALVAQYIRLLNSLKNS